MAGRGRFNRRPTPSTPSYRVNRQIKIPQIFLIDENDEKVGEIATEEARRLADAANLDLVEVAPQANPPVCRIMDFGKFKYAQRKKDRASGKKNSSGLKELRVRPAIDQHDLDYRLDQGRRFLLAGNKLQVVCIFRGRQRAFPELGEQVMQRVAASLSDLSKVESPPKMAGNRMTMMLARK